MTQTRIAVLGASGFVGRHLCAELERRGYVVQRIGRNDQLDLGECTSCVHLAEPNTLDDPEQGHDNLIRARRLLGLPFARIVYVSSAAVYGDRSSEPHRESDPVVGASAYTKAKLAVEDMLAADARSTIVRLANAYGPGMSPRTVMSDILGQVRGMGPLKLRDLAPVRDYVHVRDVAAALAELATRDVSGPFNIASGIGTSVGQIAALACAASGQPEREILATAPGQPSCLILAIDRARRELGWTPRITVEQGIQELIREQAV